MSMVFCQGCGKQIHESAPTCPHCGAPQQAVVGHGVSGSSGVSFSQAISICFSKYATFSGRARRSEYWYFVLFGLLVGIGAGIIEGMTKTAFVSAILNLIMFLPSVAAATRRLHDTGRSGWWQLLYLTIIGAFVVLIWLASDSEPRENAYGQPV